MNEIERELREALREVNAKVDSATKAALGYFILNGIYTTALCVVIVLLLRSR